MITIGVLTVVLVGLAPPVSEILDPHALRAAPGGGPQVRRPPPEGAKRGVEAPEPEQWVVGLRLGLARDLGAFLEDHLRDRAEVSVRRLYRTDRPWWADPNPVAKLEVVAEPEVTEAVDQFVRLCLADASIVRRLVELRIRDYSEDGDQDREDEIPPPEPEPEPVRITYELPGPKAARGLLKLLRRHGQREGRLERDLGELTITTRPEVHQQLWPLLEQIGTPMPPELEPLLNADADASPSDRQAAPR